jgi:hypothetical protein
MVAAQSSRTGYDRCYATLLHTNERPDARRLRAPERQSRRLLQLQVHGHIERTSSFYFRDRRDKCAPQRVRRTGHSVSSIALLNRAPALLVDQPSVAPVGWRRTPARFHAAFGRLRR